MVALIMTLFIILSALLVLIILVQPGKGDMGLGSIGRGGQQFFGGSGGQDFFEKTTWIMGALFMVGALGLSILRSDGGSRIAKYRVEQTEATAPVETPPAQ